MSETHPPAKAATIFLRSNRGMKAFNFFSIVILSSLLALASCTPKGLSRNSEPLKMKPLHLANPASSYCLKKGGKIFFEQDKNGNKHGICGFEDNRQCEEWALFRGNCPAGGLKVTGYDTWDEKYCAIRGGKPFGADCLLPEDINLSEAKLMEYRCDQSKKILIAWNEGTAILLSNQKKTSYQRALSASGSRYTNNERQLWSYRKNVMLSDGSDKSEECVPAND